MGRNKPANKDVDNNVGVKDEIGLEDIQKESRKAIEDELKMFQDYLEQAKKSKENFKEQWEVDKRLYELILENPKKKPEKRNFDYEDSDEYWNLRKKQLEFKYRQDKHMSEAKLKNFDDQIKKYQEQIDSAKKQLAEFDRGEKNE